MVVRSDMYITDCIARKEFTNYSCLGVVAIVNVYSALPFAETMRSYATLNDVEVRKNKGLYQQAVIVE